MSRMRQSSNPVFRTMEKNDGYVTENTASYTGITVKIGLMFLLMLVGGIVVYNLINADEIQRLTTILPVAAIAGFISIMIAIFSTRLAAPFSLLYAFAQGITIGTITLLLEQVIPGIGTVAGIATATIFGVMFLLYSIKAIRVTPRFRKVMFGTIIAILIFSILAAFVAPIRNVFYGNGPLAIGISLFLILYGAFMLMLDFERAKNIVEYGADKRQEWQVAVGMLVTIIWIYVEILRLLVIIASRRD